MKFSKKLHMYHKYWRWRLKTEERYDIRFLLNLDLAGRTVFDVGANMGVYSYWMSKAVGEKGRVVAFEPQQELDVFLNDVKLTFILWNLTVVNSALSDSSGTQALFRDKVGAGGATFRENHGDQQIQVSKITMDEFVAKNNIENLAYIKCDVERHELEVFKGGKDSIKKYQPIIQFECHHEEAEKGGLFNYLTELGYDGFFFFKGKRIHFSKYGEYSYFRGSAVGHRNYIFINREKGAWETI